MPDITGDIATSYAPHEHGTLPELHEDKADSSHVVAKVWPDLTVAEVTALIAHYPILDGIPVLGSPSIRPLSSANIVALGDTTVFVKRHHRSVRSGSDLEAEHSFIRHLASKGFSTPTPIRGSTGQSAIEAEWEGREWTYEVFPLAPGEDRYRGRPTWSPFLDRDDAVASGIALARLHQAASGYTAPRRPVGVLHSHLGVFGVAADPIARIEEILPALPGVEKYLTRRPWRKDLAPHIQFNAALQPEFAALPPLWTHNDWHSSNQFFEKDGVASVIDFGLSDRTTRIYDVAVALERNTLQWIELLAGDENAYRLDQAEDFLRGYVAISPLSDAEKSVLPALLPIAQTDFALSGLEYYVRVLADEDMAAWGYESFLIDHTAWFFTFPGKKYLSGIRRILERL